MLSIGTLTHAQVLAALYNASAPLGMGFLQYVADPMTVEQAQELIDNGYTDFDYLAGRVMKLRLADEIDERFYDRDGGQGLAALVLETVERTGDVNNLYIQAVHQSRLGMSAQYTVQSGTETKHEGNVITLGMDPLAQQIAQMYVQA